MDSELVDVLKASRSILRSVWMDSKGVAADRASHGWSHERHAPVILDQFRHLVRTTAVQGEQPQSGQSGVYILRRHSNPSLACDTFGTRIAGAGVSSSHGLRASQAVDRQLLSGTEIQGPNLRMKVGVSGPSEKK